MINSIDEYIEQFADNEPVFLRLKEIKSTIKAAAPNALEKISWQMPTFIKDGILIQFAAFKNHISIFPGPKCIETFMQLLSEYKTSKGTIQFSNSKPIPYNLIRQIVEYNIKENMNKKKEKTSQKNI